MKLLELELHNFKGIGQFTLDTYGDDVEIYGENASGKTTLFDAFTWLLFGKDSQNKSDFAIKTLRDGKAISGLDHEVEALLDLGESTVRLRKVYKETWTKKRGSATETFTGHTTDYYLNGVPVQKKDYDAAIANICDEATFKLLTSPTYFNEQLHWEKRRQVLLEVCGDVSDADVIASDESLSRLPEILEGRSLDDHRKVIAAKKAEINKELQQLPARIDEVYRGLPDVSEIDREKIEKELETLRGERSDKSQELARIEAGGEIAEKIKALREVEANLQQCKTKHLETVDVGAAEKRTKLSEQQMMVDEIRRDIVTAERTRDGNIKEIDRLNKRAERLRSEWREIANEEPPTPGSCPTCRQPLPQSAIDEAIAKHNKRKAERLEENENEGKALKAQMEKLAAENDALADKVKKAEIGITATQGALDATTAELASIKAEPLQETAEYKTLVAKKDAIQSEIDTLSGSKLEAAAAVKSAIRELETAIQQVEASLSRRDSRERGETRIEELKAQEKKLAAEYESLEADLFLTEEFIRAKVGMLQAKINSKFQHARFKLFESQVNGGIQEVCETTYLGVPYSSMNNAARISVGLDIIQTLSRHYGFSAPVFVDNAEAIVSLPTIESQIIALYVSEKHKELTVETVREMEEVNG